MQVLYGKLNKPDHVEYLDLRCCGEEAVAACEATQVGIWIQKYNIQILILLIHILFITLNNGYTLDTKA
jgi:hypothetical protein